MPTDLLLGIVVHSDEKINENDVRLHTEVRSGLVMLGRQL